MNHSFTRLVTKHQLYARDVAGTGHMVDRINRAKVHTVTESRAPSLHHFLPTALLLVSLVRKLTQGAKDIKKAVYMGTRMGATTRGQRQGSEPEAREALATRRANHRNRPGERSGVRPEGEEGQPTRAAKDAQDGAESTQRVQQQQMRHVRVQHVTPL